MRVAPVSADLLIKLAIAAGVIGAAWWALERARAQLAAVPIPNLAPWDAGNVVNQGVASLGGAIFTEPDAPGKNADGSWSLGGWFYDVTH